MIYASVEQFVLRIGELEVMELSDREHLGKVNQAVVNIALEDASSQIDGYLSARYRLPLPVVPANLTRLCCDVARYRLASMSGTGITDEIIERYKLSLKELEQIAAGKISLGIDDSLLNAGDGNNDNTVQFFNGNNRVFSRDNAN